MSMLAHACSRVLSPGQRSRIARRAAKARWARQQNVLQVSQIRTTVKAALQGVDARAYLFSPYASGQATADSDIDIMVVQKKPVKHWLAETSVLRRRLQFSKSLDLVVEDEAFGSPPRVIVALWPSGKHVKFVLVVSVIVLGFELNANAEFFALNFHELATLHPSPQQLAHPRKHFIPGVLFPSEARPEGSQDRPMRRRTR
jgi:predicted nucleotidyltransferase